MKIYTKTGDKGTTSLLGGTRVSKGDLRLEAYGTIDELNSWVGLVRDQNVNTTRHGLLISIQEKLFAIGSHLANDAPENKFGIPEISESDITELEQAMDQMDAKLTPLRNFVLPGGHPSISYTHIARTVCRRAERNAIRLSDHAPVDELIIKYVNRLSDYFFVLARMTALELGVVETPWQPKKK